MRKAANRTSDAAARLDLPVESSLRQIMARLDAKLSETSLLTVSSAALEAAADDLEDADAPRLPQHDQTRASMRAERIAGRLGCVYGYQPQDECYWFRRDQRDRRN